MSPGFDAAIFYLSVIALCGGVVRALCAAVERQARDRTGIMIAACGMAGLGVAIAIFVTGPRTLLPF